MDIFVWLLCSIFGSLIGCAIGHLIKYNTTRNDAGLTNLEIIVKEDAKDLPIPEDLHIPGPSSAVAVKISYNGKQYGKFVVLAHLHPTGTEVAAAANHLIACLLKSISEGEDDEG